MNILVFFVWALSAIASPITPKFISKVFEYRCERLFFEGEGVSRTAIECLARQRLGFYHANYNFYLYSGAGGSNFSKKIDQINFPEPICGLASLPKLRCEQQPRLWFGLSEMAEGVFQIPVSLAPGPELQGSVYGYAAPLDRFGRCGEGLVKMKPYFAAPPSMISPLPSNFINLNGQLNDLRVASTELSETMKLYRTPAVDPCDSKGKCRVPNGRKILVHEETYTPSSPVVCVVPASNLLP